MEWAFKLRLPRHTEPTSTAKKDISVQAVLLGAKQVKVQQQQQQQQQQRTSDGSRYDPAVFDWSNRCRYECKICGVVFSTYKLMAVHLRFKHGLAVSGYTKKHGRMAQERLFHTCGMCDKNIIHTFESLSRHFRLIHNQSLQSYFWARIARHLPNLDWKNGCTYRCSVCQESLASMASFNIHLSLKHGVKDLSEYVLKHGDPVVNSALFSCPVCVKTIAHDGDDVTLHMAECHPDLSEEECKHRYYASRASMTWQDYQALKSPAISPPRMNDSKVKLLNVNSEIDLRTIKPSHPSKSHSKMKKKGKKGLKLEWNHMVVFCPACPSMFYSNDDVKSHLWKKKIAPSQAIRGPCHIHMCRICKRSIKCTAAKVRRHLSHKHSMTLGDYERKFYDSLRQELSRAAAKSRSIEHPGYNVDICKKQTLVSPSKGLQFQKKRQIDHNCSFGWNHDLFFCPACPAILHSRNAKNKHLWNKKIHSSSAIPGPHHTHECHICKKGLKCSNENIKYHLRVNHDMTLQDYETRFFDSLKNELSMAEKKLRAVKHPGFDPNFMKSQTCNSRENQDVEGQLSEGTDDNAKSDWSPLLIDVHSITKQELLDS